jgi:hypothetical protein
MRCDKYTYISKNIFLCVAYSQYPNIFWMFFKKTLLEVLKMCFRMDFLNITKIIFLYFRILQRVCETPKGIDQYSLKNTKILFWGNSSIIYR